MKDESFGKYFYEKEALLNACNIIGHDAVLCIIGGIFESHIKSAARTGNYEDPEALFEYLRRLTNDKQGFTFLRPLKQSFT